MSRSAPHVPGLDGLRGVAVAGVVLFHLDLVAAQGGYLGVDVFFVLSGFLITSLLIREVATTGGVSLGSFWARRARRLLPAMLVALVGIAVYARFLGPTEQRDHTRRDALAALGYVYNWVRSASKVSYFDGFAAKSPVEHFWSLAVEEQFYLAWPLIVVGVVWWVRRRTPVGSSLRRPLGRAMAVVGVLGAAASAVALALMHHPGGRNSALYFRTDTRAHALLIGVALAGFTAGSGHLFAGNRGRRATPLGWVAAAGLVAVMVAGMHENIRNHGGSVLVALGTAAVILELVLHRTGLLSRLLSTPPLVWLGRISYSLYLWHWPVRLALAPPGVDIAPPLLALTRIAVSLVLAWLSLVLVEQPIRSGLFRGRGEAIVALTSVAVVAAGLVWATTGDTLSLQERYDLAASRPDDPEPPDHTEVLVVGDELAPTLGEDWAPATGSRTTDRAAVDVTNAGDVCSEDRCADGPARIGFAASAAHPDVVVVAVDSWLHFDDGKFAHNLFEAERSQQEFARRMEDLVQVLRAPGRAVVFATLAPEADRPDAQFVRLTRSAADQVAVTHPGTVSTWQLDSLGCQPGSCAQGTASFVTLSREAHARALAGADDSPAGADDSPAGADDSLPRVLLLGDSVAWSIGDGWFGRDNPSQAPLRLWNRAEFGCFPSDETILRFGETTERTSCPHWERDWKALLDEFHPDVVVVALSQWMANERVTPDGLKQLDDPRVASAATRSHARLLQLLGEGGRRVVVLNVPPARPDASPDEPASRINRLNRNRRRLNDLVARLTVDQPNITIADLSGFVCPRGRCGARDRGMRPDGSHFSPTGAHRVAEWLTPKLLGS